MRRRLLILLCWLCAALPAQESPPTDQVLTDQALTDRGYLFRLQRPGEAWRLLDEQESVRVTPDSLGALVNNARHLYMVVIAEPYPAGDPEVFARTCLEGMAVEELQVELLEAGPPEAEPRWARYVIRARVQDMVFRFCNRILLHRGYAYQLLGWGPHEQVPPDGSSFEPCWSAFSFLEGDTVPGRQSSAQLPDTTGVGWRLRDGVYASAAYGFEVTPSRPGWRVVTGVDLDNMDPGAEVGLQCSEPDLYVTIAGEYIGELDPAAYAQTLRRDFTEQWGIPPAREVEHSIGGEPATFTFRLSPEAGGLELGHAVHARGSQVLQVTIWWLQGLGELARPEVEPGLAQIRWLSSTEVETLAREIRAEDDPRSRVGPDHSLREGVYRDFAGDLIWTCPPGWWRVQTGPEARQEGGETCRLALEGVGQGIYGLLYLEQVDGLDAVQYHQLLRSQVRQDAAAEDPVQPEKWGEHWYASDLTRRSEGSPEVTFSLLTNLRGTRGVQLLLWGASGVMASATDQVEAVRSGLELPTGDLVAVERRRNAWIDHRMGFSFVSPDPSWRIQDLTRPQLKPIGSIVQFGTDPEGVIVMAVCLAGAIDEAWIEETMEKRLLEVLSRELQVTFFRPTPYQVAGGEGTRRVGRNPNGKSWIEVVKIVRHRVSYTLIAVSESGSAPPLEQAMQGLTLH